MYKYLLLMLLAVSTESFCGDVRIGVGLGRGEVSLSSSYQSDTGFSGSEPTAMDLNLGYVLPKNVFIDVGVSSMMDDWLGGVSDSVSLKSREIRLGYLYQYGPFYVEPTLGLASWRLESEEGELFHPGPENSFENDGVDPVLLVKLGHRFVDAFGLSFAYKYIDFEYGKAQSYILGFDFAF